MRQQRPQFLTERGSREGAKASNLEGIHTLLAILDLYSLFIMFKSESIGSVPRTSKLQAALASGNAEEIAAAQAEAVEETLKEILSISGTNAITDGEQVQLFYWVDLSF